MSKSKFRILYIQILVVIYSLTGVLSKTASTLMGSYGLISWQVISVMFLMVVVLGVYAILWQRVLKKTDLSIAYMNKGMQLFWALLWSVIFFHEHITLNNILGSAIILAGIMVVSKDDK